MDTTGLVLRSLCLFGRSGSRSVPTDGGLERVARSTHHVLQDTDGWEKPTRSQDYRKWPPWLCSVVQFSTAMPIRQTRGHIRRARHAVIDGPPPNTSRYPRHGRLLGPYYENAAPAITRHEYFLRSVVITLTDVPVAHKALWTKVLKSASCGFSITIFL